MKKLTRERVVPIISASVSWLTLDDRFRQAFLAEIRQQQKCPRQAFLAGIEQLIDQVLLDPTVAGQQVGDKQPANAGSSWITPVMSAFDIRARSHNSPKMACTPLQPSLPIVAISMMLPSASRLPIPLRNLLAESMAYILQNLIVK
jgi:hypothetical protein